jgi:bifunctional non-homologous end joining protein LigD
MSLREYKRKRNFRRTPEPAGGAAAKSKARQFVVQKHDATRLHYDFRLELDGTLKSWAVPKGPSLDPAVKALAVHVEDHPLEYAGFEGTIPKGQYGGGTVMVWDRGQWEPDGDPKQGYRQGKLKFRLHGEKLHGSWALVRMGGRAGEDGKNWLLIKHDDEAA